jgi:hypothetical protein
MDLLKATQFQQENNIMEMIDVLNKLHELENKSPEVTKAITSVEKTNITQEAKGKDHDKDGDVDSKDWKKSKDIAIKKAIKKESISYKDFLASKGVDIYKLTGDEHVKYSTAYRDNRDDQEASDSQSQTDAPQQEGRVKDAVLGAEERVGDYIDDDGNLKMPKNKVLYDLKAQSKQTTDAMASYELNIAIDLVQDKFDDNGQARPDEDDVPHDVDTQMNMDAPTEAEPQTTEPKVEEEMTPMGTRMFFDMGAKLDINFDMDQKGMMAGVLNRLDQDALMKSVDEYKAQELDPDQAESEQVNTNTMKTEDKKPLKEDKKPVKEAITMSADSPEEAGMLMQIMKLAGVQQVTPDMIGGEEPAADNDADHDHDGDGEQDHAPEECPVCGNDGGDMRNMMSKVDDREEPAEETYSNTPDEKTQDIDDLVNVHSGGLNRQKQQVRKEYPGDNPLAVKEDPTEEELSNSLRNQYEGFKKSYSEAISKTKESK